MANKAFNYIQDALLELGAKLIPLIIMGLITLASFWFLKKNTSEELPSPPRVLTHEPDYIFSNAKLTVLNLDGSTKYRLLGKEFKHYEDDASIDINLPRLRLMNPKAPPLTVSANKGQITGDLDIVELFNNADISRPAEVSPSGKVINPYLHMQSNYLKFFINEDKMTTHLPIKIQRGESIMTSTQGANYNNINQSLDMFGNVQGTIAPGDTSKSLNN
jgi:lipopolysaccharide export system protein LptC